MLERRAREKEARQGMIGFKGAVVDAAVVEGRDGVAVVGGGVGERVVVCGGGVVVAVGDGGVV